MKDRVHLAAKNGVRVKTHLAECDFFPCFPYDGAGSIFSEKMDPAPFFAYCCAFTIE
jgi:hypothetical protein